MILYFLKRLRRLFKSIGKIEFKFIDKIVLLENNLIKKKFILSFEDSKLRDFQSQLDNKNNFPKKMVILICFFFKDKKLNNLRKSISQISNYKFRKELIFITNELSSIQKKKLNDLTKNRIKNFQIYQTKNLPDNNFLPWFSINLMKEKFKNKKNTHFMFLEDDIIVNSNNICYWVFFRKYLKKFNLIPGFLRFENNNRNLYTIDNPKKISFKNSPKIFTKGKKFGFINSKYPYSAMYLMDRELMRNYLKSDAIKIDFSFTNRVMKFLYPIKELLNISYAYLDVPRGFHNKIMIPFNKDKSIFKYCLIEHSETKYVKHSRLNKMGYGKILIKDLIN